MYASHEEEVEIVKKFEKMVWSIAYKIYRRHEWSHSLGEIEDFAQEGFIGLIKAIRHFDPNQEKAKFSTYAYTCIYRRIFNMAQYAGLISISRSAHEAMMKSKEEREKDETWDKLVRSAQQARRLVSISTTNFNYKHPLDARLAERFKKRKASKYEFVMDDGKLTEAMKAMNDERSKSVIERRFGFNDGEEETLSQIAETMNISKERVRQIEQRGMDKLKARLKWEELFVMGG